MIFVETSLAGTFVITPEPVTDQRGAFARTFARDEFAGRDLDSRVDQCSMSFNPRAGTLRGMHYQAAPHGEAKLVRCTRGSIYDVAVDLRADSPSYGRWFAAILSADNRDALFIPAGCAHGFQTLSDNSEVLYQISTPYVRDAARGVRWNDSAFAIEWPPPPAGGLTISERDATYPDFTL